jgi:hypothetical protein
MSSPSKKPGWQFWLIVCGSAVVMLLIGVGLWLTVFNTAFKRMSEAYTLQEQESRKALREYIREVASRASPEIPMKNEDAARYSFVAEQGEALVWSSFGEGRPVTLINSPEELGGKSYCGFSGPNGLGQLLVCVEEFYNTDQQLYVIDLPKGAAKLVKRAGPKPDAGFGPEFRFHLAKSVPMAAVWLETEAEQIPGAYYLLAKPEILNLETGSKTQCPERMIEGSIWLSPDGSRLYGIGLVSEAYAKWLKSKSGAPPDAAKKPLAPAVFRWFVESGRIEWMEAAQSFGMTSDERLMTLMNYGEAPKTINLETRQEVFHMPPRVAVANAWALEDGFWYVEAAPERNVVDEKSDACRSGGALQPALFRAETGHVSRADMWVCVLDDGSVHSSAGPWPGPSKRVQPPK